jgi:hypothetical protein
MVFVQQTCKIRWNVSVKQFESDGAYLKIDAAFDFDWKPVKGLEGSMGGNAWSTSLASEFLMRCSLPRLDCDVP